MLRNCVLCQAILQKAGKASVLGSMDENDPDAAEDDDEEDVTDEPNGQESSTIVDSLASTLQKTGLVSK